MREGCVNCRSIAEQPLSAASSARSHGTRGAGVVPAESRTPERPDMSHAVRRAAVLLVALASAGCSLDKPAWLEQKQQNEAEANFYAEQEYDGRLYVFGTSKLYSQFQATHEMPYSISFIGAGPNGQTVKIE